MIEQLQNIKAPKFLRYLFFVTYSFYRRFISERNDAHLTAITFLGMIHLMIYLGLMMWTTKLFDKPYAILIVPFTLIQTYIWFVYKEKWSLYIEEFKHVKRNKQLWGGIYLFIYLLIGLMFIFLPILLEVFFDIRIVPKLK